MRKHIFTRPSAAIERPPAGACFFTRDFFYSFTVDILHAKFHKKSVNKIRRNWDRTDNGQTDKLVVLFRMRDIKQFPQEYQKAKLFFLNVNHFLKS